MLGPLVHFQVLGTLTFELYISGICYCILAYKQLIYRCWANNHFLVLKYIFIVMPQKQENQTIAQIHESSHYRVKVQSGSNIVL